MPWEQVTIMSRRAEFVRLASQPGVNRAELCRRFNISRKTGYKLLRRLEKEGAQAIADRSRRPHHSPKRTDERMEQQVMQLREQYHWGGRKIAHRLRVLGHAAPAPSTVTDILRRRGLLDETEALKHRALRRFERAQPNELWQMDFKGHFATDSTRCHPLTVLDDHSRFCIRLQACEDERADTVEQALFAAFQLYGLPLRMLMDNGSPWGSDAGHPLTVLTVWLIRLGIHISHGRPYHPQTQGKDERFHRSLNCEVLRWHRFTDLQHCQRSFDRWRDIYNLERPHEALGMQTPVQRYRPSVRGLPAKLSPIEYAEHDEVRIVHHNTLCFRGHRFRISKALHGYPVALRPTSTDGEWTVHFCHQRITTIDLRSPQA